MEIKNILLVEDNAANRMVFQDILELEGYTVRGVESAEDALAVAREGETDLVLMDIQLPGMDGLSATRVLRQDPITRHLPILALTSHAMPGDREKALVAGCNGYITKPIRVENFREEVGKCLRRFD